MLLNKMLNHDRHKQIKPSSLEVIFLPPRRSLTPPSYLNRLLNTEARPAGGKQSGDACM